MFRKLALAMVTVVAALLAYAATRPDTFEVTRSITIKAPADKVFGHIADFHRWQAWSPWEGRDPAMKRSYSGSASGMGAAYAWEGNKDVGKGRMEILEATVGNRVIIKLDFLQPFEAHNTADFALKPSGDGASTDVTWAMRGPMPYISKVMGIFVSMDRLIGGDFEAGLAKLKAVSEQ